MNTWLRAALLLLWRSAPLRWSAVTIIVTTLCGWTFLAFLETLSLSRAQKAVAVFGSADGHTGFTTPLAVGESPPVLPAIPSLTAQEREIACASALDGKVMYYEIRLPSFPAEGRLELREGRWPTRPGEVIATGSTGMHIGSRVGVAHGSWDLTVVGLATETFDTDARAVYAAPGTWQTWRLSDRDKSMLGITGETSVYWTSDDLAQTEQEIEQTWLPLKIAGTGDKHRLLHSGPNRRITLERGISAALVPLFAAGAFGLLFGRTCQRMNKTLCLLGVRPRALWLAQAVVLGVTTAGLFSAAALVTWIATLGLRMWREPRLTHPIRPWEWHMDRFACTASAGVVTALILFGGVLLATPALSAFRLRPLSATALWGTRLASAGCAIAAAVITGQADTTFTGILLIVVTSAAAAALLAPSALQAYTARTVAASPQLITLRALRSGLGTYASLACGCIALAVMSAASLALAGGMTASLNERSGTGLPPGMAFLRTDYTSMQPLGADIISDFEKDVGVSGGIRFHEYAVFGTEETRQMTWVVATSAEATRIVPTLTPEQQRLLETGDALHLTTKKSKDPRDIVVPKRFNRITHLAVRDPAHHPPGTDRGLLYVGLTPAQDEIADEWTDTYGISPAYVTATSLAKPLPLSTEVQLSAAAFGLLTLVLSLAAFLNESRRMRPYLAAMLAMGLSARWLRQVLIRLAVIMGCTVTGLSALAILGIVILVRQVVSGSLLISGVPWLGVGSILAGAGLGMILSSLLAARGLTGSERHR